MPAINSRSASKVDRGALSNNPRSFGRGINDLVWELGEYEVRAVDDSLDGEREAVEWPRWAGRGERGLASHEVVEVVEDIEDMGDIWDDWDVLVADRYPSYLY